MEAPTKIGLPCSETSLLPDDLVNITNKEFIKTLSGEFKTRKIDVITKLLCDPCQYPIQIY